MFIQAKTRIRKLVQKGMIIIKSSKVWFLLRAMKKPQGKAIRIVITVAITEVISVRTVMVRKLGFVRFL